MRSLVANHSEGLRPSDSPTRSLAGPRKPHSARVGSLARSFATVRLGFEPTSTLLFVALTFLALAVGCRWRGSESTVTAPSSRPNVLLVTIDTLRADHVGSYGYHDASTQTIDALARRGVRFETAVAHAPLTGPSHASILTGQTPLGHGFRNNSGFILAPEVKTVAQDFRNAGYHTAGFVSG